MIVRRLLAGVLLASIAVPALAAAPHGHRQKAEPVPVIVGMGTRVFSRADGESVAQASPGPPASPAASASPAPGGSPPPAGSSAPAASPTPASLGAARAEYEAWMNGKIDRSHYTAEANTGLTDAVVAQVSGGLKPAGAVQDITQTQRSEPQPGVTRYVYRVRTASNVVVEMLLAVDASGKYAGIFFRPAQ
jgi:hypothetical protein